MTHRDIMRMVAEAGLGDALHEHEPYLVRFALLVAEAERNKWAAVCEAWGTNSDAALNLAALMRADGGRW